MKCLLSNSKILLNNAVFLALIIISWLVVGTIFIQFIHYDSQYRSLNPEHYKVDVITQEDYKQLSNPENRTVALSNGRTIIKADKWDSTVLPKYKSVNEGSQYVLVTVKGTAPFIGKWYEGIFPIFVICILVLFAGIITSKQKGKTVFMVGQAPPYI